MVSKNNKVNEQLKRMAMDGLPSAAMGEGGLNLPTAEQRAAFELARQQQALQFYQGLFGMIVPVVVRGMMEKYCGGDIRDDGLFPIEVVNLSDDIARAAMRKLGIEIGELEVSGTRLETTEEVSGGSESLAGSHIPGEVGGEDREVGGKEVD